MRRAWDSIARSASRCAIKWHLLTTKAAIILDFSSASEYITTSGRFGAVARFSVRFSEPAHRRCRYSSSRRSNFRCIPGNIVLRRWGGRGPARAVRKLPFAKMPGGRLTYRARCVKLTHYLRYRRCRLHVAPLGRSVGRCGGRAILRPLEFAPLPEKPEEAHPLAFSDFHLDTQVGAKFAKCRHPDLEDCDTARCAIVVRGP